MSRTRKIEAELEKVYAVPLHIYSPWYKPDAKIGAWFLIPNDSNKGYHEYLASIGYDIIFITPDVKLHWKYFNGSMFEYLNSYDIQDIVAVRTKILKLDSKVTSTSLDDYDIFEV